MAKQRLCLRALHNTSLSHCVRRETVQTTLKLCGAARVCNMGVRHFHNSHHRRKYLHQTKYSLPTPSFLPWRGMCTVRGCDVAVTARNAATLADLLVILDEVREMPGAGQFDATLLSLLVLRIGQLRRDKSAAVLTDHEGVQWLLDASHARMCDFPAEYPPSTLVTLACGLNRGRLAHHQGNSVERPAFDKLLSLLNQQLHLFSARDASAALFWLSKPELATPRKLLSSLCEVVEGFVSDLVPVALGNVFTSLGRIYAGLQQLDQDASDWERTGGPEALTVLLQQRVIHISDRLEPKHMAQILNGLSALGVASLPGLLPCIRTALDAKCAEHEASLDNGGGGMMMGPKRTEPAYAEWGRIAFGLASLGEPLWPSLLRMLDTDTAINAARLSSKDVGEVFWALAVSRVAPSSLLERLSLQCDQRYKQFQAQDVTTMLTSLMTLGRYPRQEVLRGLQRIVLARPGAFHSEECAQALWALATINLSGHRAVPLLLEQALVRRDILSFAQITTVLWSLTAFNMLGSSTGVHLLRRLGESFDPADASQSDHCLLHQVFFSLRLAAKAEEDDVEEEDVEDEDSGGNAEAVTTDTASHPDPGLFVAADESLIGAVGGASLIDAEAGTDTDEAETEDVSLAIPGLDSALWPFARAAEVAFAELGEHELRLKSESNGLHQSVLDAVNLFLCPEDQAHANRAEPWAGAVDILESVVLDTDSGFYSADIVLQSTSPAAKRSLGKGVVLSLDERSQFLLKDIQTTQTTSGLSTSGGGLKTQRTYVPAAPCLLKTQQLRAAGWTVIHIPFYQWTALESDGQQAYLAHRLASVAPRVPMWKELADIQAPTDSLSGSLHRPSAQEM